MQALGILCALFGSWHSRFNGARCFIMQLLVLAVTTCLKQAWYIVGVMKTSLRLYLVGHPLSPLTYSTQKKTFTRQTNEQIRFFFSFGIFIRYHFFVNIQGLNNDPISYEFFNILKFFCACLQNIYFLCIRILYFVKKRDCNI